MTSDATTKTLPSRPIPLTRVAVNGERLSDLVEALQQLDLDRPTRIRTVRIIDGAVELVGAEVWEDDKDRTRVFA